MGKIMMFGFWIVACVLLISVVNNANAGKLGEIPKDVNLVVMESNLDPQPVEAGENLLLTITVQNYGQKSARNVTAWLDLKGPFSFKYANEESRNIEICEFCNWKLDYHLLVNPDAKSGSYESEFMITFAGGDIKRTEKIMIDVTGKPDIVFDSPKIEETIRAGDNFNVGLHFRNIGTGIARNIKVIPSSDRFIVLGSGLKVIDLMKPGERADITMDFSADESVPPGTYSIPVQLTFRDDREKEYSLSENIGVRVLNSAELNLQNVRIEPSVIQVGNDIVIQGRVENVGKGNAENVKVVLESDLNGYKIAYLGKLKKDEDAPVIFSLRANDMGVLENRMIVTYKDDFGIHNLTERFTLNVGKNGNDDSLLVILVIIAAASVLFIVYSFFKRKKR